MITSLTASAYAMFGRLVPVMLALQDPPRAGGGGGGGGGGGAAAGAARSGGGGGGGAAGALSSMLIPLLMIGFLYFFMIRPMNKQRREADALQRGLQKGDKVVTSSGIIGTVVGLEDKELTIEISEKVRVRFLREAVSRRLMPSTTNDKGRAEAGALRTADAKK